VAEKEKEPTGSAVRKGLIGLAFAVAAGVLVWWLTSAGGPLDPKKADIHLTALGVASVFKAGTAPAATASVENSGDETATECRILWSPFSANPGDEPFPASPDFSLSPGEAQDLPLGTATPYSQSGTYEMSAQLTCGADESEVRVKSVLVP